jgi:hypothetical protein
MRSVQCLFFTESADVDKENMVVTLFLMSTLLKNTGFIVSYDDIVVKRNVKY